MPYDTHIKTVAVGKLSDKYYQADTLRSEIARLTEQLQSAERDIASQEKRERELLQEQNEENRDKWLPYGAELKTLADSLSSLHDTLEQQKSSNTGTGQTEARIAEKEARLAAIQEAVKHG